MSLSGDQVCGEQNLQQIALHKPDYLKGTQLGFVMSAYRNKGGTIILVHLPNDCQGAATLLCLDQPEHHNGDPCHDPDVTDSPTR